MMARNTVNDRAAVVLGQGDVHPEWLGGKGAALARLIAHGQPVPTTGVVTTEAYRAVAEANPTIAALVVRVDSGESVPEPEVDKIFDEAVVPDHVHAAVVAMAKTVGGGGAVAVRSSATVEDLSGSSFAGQYRSLLNVDSGNGHETMAAIRQVWASLWYPAPAAYRRAFGIETVDVAMAVVVMDMIPATTAGVVFTADPGGSKGARVEAVEGLGESLVSGERTPHAWIVPDNPNDPSTPKLPIAAQRALEHARSIEATFQVPQDVEWAAVGDDVYIVQARPITVLASDDGFDTPIDDHELTTAGIAELVPGVQPPLQWELNAFLLEQAFRAVLDSLGVLQGAQVEDRPFIRRVRGRVALDFDQLRAAAGHVPGAVRELELQYFGESGGTLATTTGGIGVIDRLRRDIRTSRTRRWVIEHADVLIAATYELRDKQPELEEISDGEMLLYHRRLLDLAARGLTGELGVAAAGGAAYDRLVNVLDSYLGSGEGAGAAQRVTAHVGAVEYLSTASAAVFAGPTWCENGVEPPARSDRDPESFRSDLAALEERIRTMPGWRRRRILTGQFVDVRMHIVRRTVDDVISQLRRREAAKAAFLELGGEIRRVHAELGRRLVHTGVLGQASDVELLSTSELVAALDGNLPLAPDVLRRRRNWLGRYDVEGQLPLRFRGIPDREPKPLPEGDVLSGWAASPGRQRGKVRIVREANGTFEAGEVLVAEATDASWSPLFMRAAAVVVERGGPLSHAAILARELGLPAVLNVDGATQVLAGCTVSVDGDLGVVVIEDRGGT